MRFFPPKSLDRDPEVDQIHHNWYSTHLLAMQEVPLYPPATDRPDVYRLLYLLCWDSPVMVHFSLAGEVWQVVCKRTDGFSEFPYGGQLTPEDRRDLSPGEATRFQSLLESAAFWDMPSCDRTLGFDGAPAILEGVKGGCYHVVDRWSPHDTPYAELVEFILGLCPDWGEQPLPTAPALPPTPQKRQRKRPRRR
jgi:hypothetical protein